MAKEDILLFSCYGMRGERRSYVEHMKEKDIEIERLNNIINELEEDIKLELSKIREQNDYNIGLHNAFAHIKFKLQELKGDNSNE